MEKEKLIKRRGTISPGKRGGGLEIKQGKEGLLQLNRFQTSILLKFKGK
jgi:hypothetical protein